MPQPGVPGCSGGKRRTSRAASWVIEYITYIHSIYAHIQIARESWELDAISSAFAPISLSVACRNASLRATIGSAKREGGVHAECAAALGSPYLQWDLGDPELAVAGTLYHGFEWAFVRVAPVLFPAAAAAALFVRERMR